MAYATYTTEALVCGSKNSHTSDRSFLLFTKRAGMLWATARSVREEKSKQRHALQDFSIIRVSLVKGKGGWRIGSVEAISNPFMEAAEQRSRAGVTTIMRLLRRFLQGEEPHEAIYNDTVLALNYTVATTGADITNITEQFSLRFLYQLGYVSPEASYQSILDAADSCSLPGPVPEIGRKAIEKALQVSHL